MNGYKLNPDAIPIIMAWLTPEPGDETAALKHQARLLIDAQAEEIEQLKAGPAATAEEIDKTITAAARQFLDDDTPKSNSRAEAADIIEYLTEHHDDCHQPAANYQLLLDKLAGEPTNHGDCVVAAKLDEQAQEIERMAAAIEAWRQAAIDVKDATMDRIFNLERAIAAMANERLNVVKNDEGETWIFLVVNGLADEPWSGPFPTPAVAALAGVDALDELEKEQGNG
jgi:hypothetical protein